MNLEQYLIQIGVNITSNAIYDIIKKLISSGSANTKELGEEIAKLIKIEGADIKAMNIINFLAERGDISINNSSIHSNDSILYSAGINNTFSLKNNTQSSTNRSIVDIGSEASIEGSGGAYMHQDSEGNISFGFKE